MAMYGYGGFNYPDYMAMMNGVQNGMMNGMQRQAAPHYEVIKVNGRNGAEAFQLAENSSVLLLDTNEPLIWFVQTDGAGYKTITPYKITPYQPAPTEAAQNLDDLECRIKRLEDIISGQSDFTKAERHSKRKPEPDEQLSLDE